jgi:hypothetical protein
MALVLLEGLDRTGKSTVASYFETLGFERIHMSAPVKGTTSDQYLQDMVDLLSSAATKDIVLDRTHYGELVWPQVYSDPKNPRKALLNEEDFEILREIENSVGVQRIWMTDNLIDAHWKRCVENKEPLDKAQFTRARALFSDMAHKYGFEPITLQQFIKKFPDAQELVDKQTADALEAKTVQLPKDIATVEVPQPVKAGKNGKTAEQHKLEVANVINDVLSKRILKGKGSVHDDLENELRAFLNSKLGKLLGGAPSETSLTSDEVRFYKEMYKRAIDKGAK